MKKTLLTLLALGSIAANAQTVTIYRAGTALSPTHSTIAAAIAAAASGDSLRLSAHTFNERDIYINKDLTFAGTITTTDTSTVDAQNLGRVFRMATSRKVNMRDMHLVNGKANIGAATAMDFYLPGNCGGGILIETFGTLTLGGRLVIRNCTAFGLGGAVADLVSGSLIDSTTVTIKENVIIEKNTATVGGGIRCLSNSKAKLILQDDIIIRENTSENLTGILFTRESSCGGINAIKVIVNGVGIEGGVRVMNNHSKRDFGGIYTLSLILNGTITVSNNVADSIAGGVGGILYLYGTGKLLSHHNKAYYGGGGGDFGYLGGDSATIIFSENTAKYGGGVANIYIQVAPPAFKNMQLINNSADIAGGGYYVNYINYVSGAPLPITLQKVNIYNNKAPKCNGLFAEQYCSVVLLDSRVFNPMASGAHSNEEVRVEDNSSFESYRSWFGESDTTGLIVKDASSAINLYSWAKCDWVVNNGMPVTWLPFPLTATMKLNNGTAFASLQFPSLEGRYSGTLGSFSPTIAPVKTSNEMESIYSTTGTGTATIMGIVDADTFTQNLSVTSIKELGFEQVKIYPNPSTDYLHIQGAAIGSTISLYDLQGKLVKSDELKGNNATIDLQALPKGNYLLKITTKEGEVGSAQIVKE